MDDYHIFGPLFQMLIIMRNQDLLCPSFATPSPSVTAFSQCISLDGQNEEEVVF